MRYQRLTRSAVLTALALIIFIVEAQLPPLVPIPGVKLGLSNTVTLFALLYLTPKEVLWILVARILLGGLVVGNPSILLYSLTGGLGCLGAELLLRRMAPIWAISIVGAMTHNLVQTVVACWVTKTPMVFSYLPILLISGMVTGLFTGLCIYFLDRFGRKTIARFLK